MRRSWLTRILTHRVSRKPTLGGTGVRRWVQNLPGVVRGAVGANSGRTGPHSALDLPLSARVLSPAGVCTERASTMPTTGRMRVPKTGAGCMRSGKPVRVSWVRMCRAGLMGSGRALRVHGVRVRVSVAWGPMAEGPGASTTSWSEGWDSSAPEEPEVSTLSKCAAPAGQYARTVPSPWLL
jgi:hypothetical protein